MNSKKILGSFLSVLLVLFLLPTAALASTLTITNTLNERVYTAYQVLNRDSSTNTYVINKNSELYSFVKTWATGSEGSGKVIFTENTDNATFEITNSYTSDTSAQFSAYLMSHVDEWSSGSHITKYTQTASGNTVMFNDINDGFYLVQSSAGMTGSMVTVRGTGTINEKNARGDIGTLTFSVDEEYLQYGDNATINSNTVFNETFTTTNSGIFRVIAKMQAYDDTNKHKCFTKIGVNEVKLNDKVLTLNTDYILGLEPDEKTLTVELQPGISIKIGDILNISYKGEVSNENLEGSLDKRLNIAYGCLTNPDINGDMTKSEDTFATLEMDVHKLPDNSKFILTGAKFKVYRGDSTEPIAFNYTQDPTGTIYMLTPKTSESSSSTITEIPMGVAKISGLANGTYKLEETQAPEGYNKLTEPVSVTLTNDSIKATYLIDSEEGISWVEGGISIINHKGIIIPSTGGIGIAIFIIAGLITIIIAVGYSIRKKQKNYITNF